MYFSPPFDRRFFAHQNATSLKTCQKAAGGPVGSFRLSKAVRKSKGLEDLPHATAGYEGISLRCVDCKKFPPIFPKWWW